MNRIAASALASVLACAPAFGSEPSLTITVENDVWTGSDNNYTNGLGVAWTSSEHRGDEDDWVGRWIRAWDFLPFVGDEGYANTVSLSLAQEMHTPDDIGVADPPLDDQPYAGVLYVNSVFYARRGPWAHAWELKVGIAGPASQADDAQKGFHRAIGADQPRGWHTQLPNEPIVNIGYTVARVLAQGSAGGSATWRAVPVASAALGNYFTGASVGMYGEVGWNLVDALGGTALRGGLNAASTADVGPVDGWSVSLFAGAAAYGVARYLPLDGTLFRDSRSVDTKPVIGLYSVGACVRHGRFVLGIASTFSSKAYATERKAAEFGTLSIAGFF
jgi:hypothetical protein